MKSKPMRILYITMLSISPAYSGGPVRVYNILRQLATKAQVTFVSPLSESVIRSDLQCAPELASVRIIGISDIPAFVPRTTMERAMHAYRRVHVRYRQWFWRHNPFRVICMPQYNWMPAIDCALQESKPDVIIFEQSWHLETLRLIRKKYPGIPCILSAQNIKTTLFEQKLILSDGAVAPRRYIRRYVRWFLRLESSLYRYVDAVWTCSADDARTLQCMNSRHPLPMTVVANGVDPVFFRYDENQEKNLIPRIIYGGTLCWAPSSEAVRYFYQEIWPLIRIKRPDIQFVIIGREPPQWLCAMVAQDASVHLVGEVSDARPFFTDASVNVCPILSGSGTRLKILEAMSMGNPVVSTRLGAEGLTAKNEEHLLMVDSPEEFADCVLRLLSDSVLFHTMRTNARTFVENHYEWSHLMQPALQSLEDITEK